MPESINHILVIDDDTRIRALLGQFLRDHGFFVSSAKDAEHARQLLDKYIFDLLIVDIMMPGESGVSFTSSVREHMEVPILMLTAMGDVEDRIVGLESGADDYMPKPFEPRELLLRIKSILQRTRKFQPSAETILFGVFTFYSDSGRLEKDGEDILLTSNEIKVLKTLGKQSGKIIPRSSLSELCGGINERSIDVQINRLRNKIEHDPKKPKFLKTMRGEGYVLYTN